MALPAITYQDFTGLYKLNIPQLNRAEFDAFTATVYADFVTEYLGNEAYTEINGQSTLEQKWQDLFNGVTYYNSDCDKTLSFVGFRDICIAGVFFKFLRDNGDYNTPTGNVNNKNGNSELVSSYHFVCSRMNRALIQLEKQVYPFICYYSSVSELITSSVDNGANSYTINVSSTKYLEDGNAVKINGIDYNVLNVVQDVSFDIVASSTGLEFGGDSFVYKPFGNVVITEVSAVW